MLKCWFRLTCQGCPHTFNCRKNVGKVVMGRMVLTLAGLIGFLYAVVTILQ